MKKFKCFSRSMAAFLSDECGFPILKKYESAVYDSMVFEFEQCEELQKHIDTYIKTYNEWKNSQTKNK